jgi:plastocyanin
MRFDTPLAALTGSAGLAAALLAGHAESATKAAAHEVTIQALQYTPQTMTVRPGDAVVWVNKDPFPHTVTAPGAFDSRSIAAGASWRYTARRAGTYAYICTLHSNMKGTLQVE